LLRNSGNDNPEQPIGHGSVLAVARRNAVSRPADAALSRSAWPPRVAFLFKRRFFPRNGSGESLVAFAITFPILCSFIFGLIQVCLAFYSHNLISELAREGTRYAIVHGASCETSGGDSCTASTTSSDPSSVDSFVYAAGLPNIAGGALTVTTTYPGGQAVGQFVSVKVNYAFPYHIPFVPSSTLAMSSTSTMQIIQ
jgi:Flp pilus assembly protein TadG